MILFTTAAPPNYKLNFYLPSIKTHLSLQAPCNDSPPVCLQHLLLTTHGMANASHFLVSIRSRKCFNSGSFLFFRPKNVLHETRQADNCVLHKIVDSFTFLVSYTNSIVQLSLLNFFDWRNSFKVPTFTNHICKMFTLFTLLFAYKVLFIF